MTKYCKEKITVSSFLAKCERLTDKKDQIKALISDIDITTLKFILTLNLEETGAEDFKKVAMFIKNNRKDILNQLEQQNLFYSRINLAFTFPTSMALFAILAVGVTHFVCPALAIVLDCLAGVAGIISSCATYRAINANMHKKELYNDIAQKLSPEKTYSSRSFFSKDERTEKLDRIANCARAMATF